MNQQIRGADIILNIVISVQIAPRIRLFVSLFQVAKFEMRFAQLDVHFSFCVVRKHHNFQPSIQVGVGHRVRVRKDSIPANCGGISGALVLAHDDRCVFAFRHFYLLLDVLFTFFA